MAYVTKLLIVANPGIESQEVREAIIERAAAGPVEITLVAPASVGAGPLCAARTADGRRVERARRIASAQRVERAAQLLRDAGVPVVGVDPLADDAQDGWDPSRFDEVVVSCSPWLSLKRPRAFPCAGAAQRNTAFTNGSPIGDGALRGQA